MVNEKIVDFNHLIGMYNPPLSIPLFSPFSAGIFILSLFSAGIYRNMCMSEACSRTDFNGRSCPSQQNCVQSWAGSYMLKWAVQTLSRSDLSICPIPSPRRPLVHGNHGHFQLGSDFN